MWNNLCSYSLYFFSTLLYPNPKTIKLFSFTFFSSTHSLLPHLLILLFFYFPPHKAPHTPPRISKGLQDFQNKIFNRAAFLLLLLSPADLLSKECSWFAISRPWTSSSIAFFLLEDKLSGQVHSIVVCVSFSVFWDFCVLCMCDCLLSFESLVFELFFLPANVKQSKMVFWD